MKKENKDGWIRIIINLLRNQDKISIELDDFKKYTIKVLKDDDLRAELGKNAKKQAENYRITTIAESWMKLYKFVINELYPLRYHNSERKRRVELVKEFIHHLPNVNF